MAESMDSITAGQPSGSDTEQLKLSDLLDRGWKIFEELDSSNESFGPNTVHRVKRGINMLEEASRMVAQLDLFSRNEEVEEIATADLKYLLLPALLGALHMKQSSQHKRLETVQTARLYFMDFLKKCLDYNISQFELPRSSDGDGVSEESPEGVCSKGKSFTAGPSNLVAMAAKRQSKIERYRQRKELETRLSDVRRVVESGQAEDEVNRDFYLLNVQRWITVCLEEIEAIDQEVGILKKMDVLKQGPANQPTQQSRHAMKPFILTRDALQAHVLGAGYPSLPTMTVDDWYEQHRKQGVLPDQGIPRKVTVEDSADAQERDEEEKERRAENDDEASLLKARNWDDWKDNHRRGYGNRQNMG